MVVFPNTIDEGLQDTGISSPVFVSPNRFGALVVEEESEELSIPLKGKKKCLLTISGKQWIWRNPMI